jgi:hypothetical protein
MLDSVIVIGVVALLIAILKASVPYFQTEVGQMWLKLLMFFAAGAFNIINGIGFSGDAVTLGAVLGYFKDGLILGAAASGIYGMGKDLTDSTQSASRYIQGRHKQIIPARKGSYETIIIGIVVIAISMLAYFVWPMSIQGNLIAAAGLLIVAAGYLGGAVSATRYQKRINNNKQ